MQETPRPPLSTVILYAVGQTGWSLASFAVGNLLVFFYMPPEQGDAGFPPFVHQGAVLGVFTLIGLLSAGGRLFDAVIDPFIAHWSDRKEARVGKRRWFLAWGTLPLAVLGFLVFFPPFPFTSAANGLWLAVSLGLFYFFFAFYVIPYTALIAELGHHASDRILISTLISVAWALGFVGGGSALALQQLFENGGMTPTRAFQAALMLLCGLSALLMAVPAVFLDERRYSKQAPAQTGLKQALREVFKMRDFRIFLASDLLYWLALTFIQLGISYYTTLLLGLDKGFVSLFSLVSFLVSFLFYVPVNLLARRLGKKVLLLAGFLAFSAVFAVVSQAQRLPLPPLVLLFAIAIVAAMPLAIFGILPNALVGDLVEEAEKTDGERRSGMFYGLRAFTMKLGISLANLVFPSLLLLGKSREAPLGVQATAVAALFFSLAGWAVLRRIQVR